MHVNVDCYGDIVAIVAVGSKHACLEPDVQLQSQLKSADKASIMPQTKTPPPNIMMIPQGLWKIP